MIELRNYQKQAIADLRKSIIAGNKKNILSLATGGGKTIIFSYMCSRAVEKSKRVLIVTDRIELITQAGGTLDKFGLKPVEIKSGRKLKSFNALLYTGMAQTLCRRIKTKEYQEFFNSIDLFIFDESHKQSFNRLMPFVPERATVIGATATPHREKNQTSLDEFYNGLVEGVSISKLIELGFLSRPESYGVKVDLSGIKTKGGDYDDKTMGDKYDEIQLYHGVYENYMRITPNQKAIIFAPNIKASKTLVCDFKDKGLPIEHLDGETPTAERKRILKWYKETSNAMISNVGILNAGFDDPSILVVILYRATKSLPLYLQMVGRGSRVINGVKDKFTILDFGNNIARHGFWEQDREWSLKRKPKSDGVAPVKDCPSCFAMLPASVPDCKYCGHIFEKTEKEKQEEVIAELQKLTYAQIQDEVKTANFERLHQIATAKGYRKSWIYYHLKTEEELINYANWKGYHINWVNHQLNMRKNEE
tara:strand:- start:28537 stop:29970 length:1434 start_codon:yes stop_codon:yes gene_type:complete